MPIPGQRRLVVAALCAVWVLVLPASTGAADPEDELEGVQEQLEETREHIEGIEQERTVTLEDLAGIDARLAELDRNLASLQSELADAQHGLEEAEERLARTTSQLVRTEQRLDDTRDRLDGERRVFADRTRASFIYGGPAQMTASMFDAADVAEFGRAMRYVQRVMASDRDRVTLVSGLVREIEADTVELGVLQEREADERRLAGTERDRVAGLVEAEESLRRQVADQRAERQAALNELEADKEAHLEIAAALEAESQRLEDELRRRAEEERRRAEEARRREAAQREQRQVRHDPPASTGQLQRPADGPVTSGYGWRTHPIFGTQRFHAGIDFGGGHGAPIYAADDGVVVSAGARGGYGMTVIIDHGGGMTTLYAHQSRFAVSGGQAVQRGQVIGFVGSTGYSTGPHLHFEVRINGEPRNPRDYL